MQISQEKTKRFQEEILTWYNEHQRDLPWRHTRDPYRILISEVMSQQTQISRVVTKYTEWLVRFPTVVVLADAPVSEVLKYWSGLGYNRRALNLKKTAEKIVNEYDGTFPDNERELLKLPGIGPYTARAILCFAFNKQVAVVDTNVRKVILTQIIDRSNVLRLSDSSEKTSLSERDMEEIAQKLLPHGKAYEWNQALMDYSSAVLKKEKMQIPKQSKFIGSHRYYRSKVLRVLLDKKKVNVDKIGELIKKEYTIAEEEWLSKLLNELAKEGFIVIEKNFVRLV